MKYTDKEVIKMRRKRRNWPFDSPFDDFFDMDIEEEFERMRRMMDMMMQRAMESDMQSGEPMVYGFSMRIGPDGKPVIQQFGNTFPRRIGEGESAESQESFAREPLTDVMESEDSITITVELPGVSKEDIELMIAEDRLIIKVDTAARRYYKEIPLSAEIDEKNVRATYNNGVLDITLKKLKKEKSKGKRISIE